MQKTNKKASILIWSFFLSLVIIISFVSISSKINKNIKNNISLENEISVNSKIKQKIVSKDFMSESIGNKKIIFENSKTLTGSIEKNEKINLKFSGTSNGNLKINILNGGPIYYEFLSYSGAVTSAKQVTASGIINTNKTFIGELNKSYDFGNLKIENLGGFTNFIINSDIKFLGEYKNYKIIKNIGNKQIIEKKGKIKLQ